MEDDLLPKRHFESLRQLESFYWWHQTRLAISRSLLRSCRFEHPSVLDLGCGTGAFLSAVGAELGAKRVVGVDASPTALEYIQELGLEHICADLGKPLAVKGGHFHLVTAMDVLEHLEHPEVLVQSAWDNLVPGGYFFASVPAHPFLYSDWDKMLHHVCRFSRKALKRLVLTGHFSVQRLSYAFFIPFFGALTVRKFRKGRDGTSREEFPTMPSWLNRVLLAEGKLEAGWLRWLPLPTGLSLYVLAQKPGEE